MRRSYGAGSPWLITPQIAVDLVAGWYDLPSLAPRNALWHRDCEDRSFRGLVCDSGGLGSCGHLRPVGHAIVGHVVATFLEEAATRARAARARTIGPAALPPPLFDVGTDGATHGAACVRGAELSNTTWRRVGGDWRFVRRDPEQPKSGADKPGLLSLCAPSVLHLDVGNASQVVLAFLLSYDERMGTLLVECIDGCTCEGQRFSGYHTKKTSILSAGLVSVSSRAQAAEAASCTLRLTHVRRAERPAAGGQTGCAACGDQARCGGTAPSRASKFKLLATVSHSSPMNRGGAAARTMMRSVVNGLGQSGAL